MTAASPATGPPADSLPDHAALRTGTVLRPEPIHDLVQAVVVSSPDASALAASDGDLSYAQLWAAAQRWSGLLAQRGISPGDIVVIGATRSAAMVACLLGVLIRGASYSVIDPTWPYERRRSFATTLQSRMAVGISASELGVTSVEQEPLHAATAVPEYEAAPGAVDADAIACIFFTSGSTGHPKAARIPHRSLTRLFGTGTPIPIGPGRALPSLAGLAWDGFALELWSQLTAGGRVLLHESPYFLPNDLRAAVSRGATDVFLTSGLFDIFVSEDVDCFSGLASVWVGGDRLAPDAVARFAALFPDTPLLNVYGPVECGIFVTVHRVRADDAKVEGGVPVGYVVPETAVAIVDGTDILPVGVEGEIWVGGRAVTGGYLGVERDATVRYCPAPRGIDGELRQGMWYRTGDRGVMDGDGLLHFRGRADRQVKIGGHRIEPAEVELAARRLGCVHACVVPVRRDGKTTGLAMAAVPAADKTAISPRELRRLIAGMLPAQLVPWPIVFVASLPLDANGKVDRNSVEALISGGVQK